MADLPGLADRLRWLIGHALQSGAPAEQIDAVADALVGALLELDDFREGARDPRRVATLAKAVRVAHAKESGASIQQLAIRFACGRQHIHRLLKLHADTVARHAATLWRLNGASHQEHR